MYTLFYELAKYERRYVNVLRFFFHGFQPGEIKYHFVQNRIELRVLFTPLMKIQDESCSVKDENQRDTLPPEDIYLIGLHETK